MRSSSALAAGSDRGSRLMRLIAQRLIVDLDEGMSWPLEASALEELRWYLEDYLRAPFGVYEDRGARIEAKLPKWGQAMFESVFAAGPARDAYARAPQLSEMELVLRSSSADLLGLPWELMAAPEDQVPLALGMAGTSRTLLGGADDAGVTELPGGRLRVLMVISRPSGSSDVGYQMIARPLLRRLKAAGGSISLTVLRPPALEALRGELTAAAKASVPYQVVHFDGHGTSFGGEGALVFERPGGGDSHLVPAAAIAQALGEARVQVAVLNACQSGAVAGQLEAAIATRLLRDGVASVVAMAYLVYSAAAAEFIGAFYEALFAGRTVSAAVTAGRRQMARKPGRPSPKGVVPLADWVVPVHYVGREVSFPPHVQPLQASPSPSGEESHGDLDSSGGTFIGRDSLFWELEAAGREKAIIILTGPGGAGKTELARAFGRWWRDTGGVERPELVFWHSFEPGVASFGVDGVITGIGVELFGTGFARLSPEQRRSKVVQALNSARSLLICDNFESVRSMPDPGRAMPLLDEAECEALHEFLVEVASHGTSTVLLTSRTPDMEHPVCHPVQPVSQPACCERDRGVREAQPSPWHPSLGAFLAAGHRPAPATASTRLRHESAERPRPTGTASARPVTSVTGSGPERWTSGLIICQSRSRRSMAGTDVLRAMHGKFLSDR